MSKVGPGDTDWAGFDLGGAEAAVAKSIKLMGEQQPEKLARACS